MSAIRQRFDRTKTWAIATYARARRRFPWLEHFARAVTRFSDTRANRLAAALTYTSFLAVFPVLLLGFAILGFVLNGNPAALAKVTDYLHDNIPTVRIDSITNARFAAGVVGALGVLYTGVGWVEAVRGSVRAVWQKPEDPERLVVAKALDVVAMIGLGFLLLVSMLITFALSAAFHWVFSGVLWSTAASVLLGITSFALGVFTNVLLLGALLSALPRLRMRFKRLFGPALLGGIGLELLKTFGQLLLSHTVENPAYGVVATAVGILLFLNFFNKLLFFCAALTATSLTGEVAERPRRWLLLFARSSDSSGGSPRSWGQASVARAKPQTKALPPSSPQ